MDKGDHVICKETSHYNRIKKGESYTISDVFTDWISNIKFVALKEVGPYLYEEYLFVQIGLHDNPPPIPKCKHEWKSISGFNPKTIYINCTKCGIDKEKTYGS